MSIIKYTPEQKLQACIDYTSGIKTATKIAHDLNMTKNGVSTVMKWVISYKANGKAAFFRKHKRKYYTKEFKEMLITEYKTGNLSINELTAKYNLPSFSTLSRWIKQYNDNNVVNEKITHTEVVRKYMFKSTQEKKLSIVRYCLDHEKNVKETAAVFGCTTGQLYTWLKKYKLYGEEGLVDKRSSKQENIAISETDKLKQKLKETEREKEEYHIKYELLKKAEKEERWW